FIIVFSVYFASRGGCVCASPHRATIAFVNPLRVTCAQAEQQENAKHACAHPYQRLRCRRFIHSFIHSCINSFVRSLSRFRAQIIYESPDLSPLLRLSWNKQDEYYLATFCMDSNKAIILDIRVPTIPAAELTGHTAR